MNAALLKKTLYESRWLLVGSMAFMFAVHWLRVWISSFFSTSAMEGMLSFMPELVETLMPVSFAQIATSAGRIGSRAWARRGGFDAKFDGRIRTHP